MKTEKKDDVKKMIHEHLVYRVSQNFDLCFYSIDIDHKVKKKNSQL